MCANKEYEVKVILDGAIYKKELEIDQLLGLYHQILWKNYFKKNTWEPLLAV